MEIPPSKKDSSPENGFVRKRSVGMLISYLYTFVSVATNLILASFLLAKLGDTEYGLYQTVSSFVNYLVLFEFGIGTVMTRNVSLCRSRGESEKLNATFSTLFIIAFILAGIILCVGVLFFCLMPSIYVKTMTAAQVRYARKLFVFLIAFLLMKFFTQVVDGFLLGMERYSFAKTRAIILSLLKLALILVIVSFRQYSIVIVAVDFSLSALFFVITALYCKKRYHIRCRLRFFDREILLSAMPLCFALFLQSVINQANSNVDKFLIGVMMSVEDVALYSVAQFFNTIFASIMEIPVPMYLPELARVMTPRPSPEALTQKLIAPCRVEALVGGLILGGIVAAGRPFVILFFGPAKQTAWLYAVIVLIPMYVNMTNAVIVSVLDVLNKRLMRSVALFITAGLNVLLTVLLIRKYGIIGAVAATAVSLIAGNIVFMNVYYRKKLGIRVLHLFRQSYRGILIPCMVAAAAGFFVSRLISQALPALFAAGVVFLGIALPWIWFFGLTAEERQPVVALLQKFRKRAPGEAQHG